MNRFIALFIFTSLSGCANTTTPIHPPISNSKKVLIKEIKPTADDKFGATNDIPDSYFGITRAKRNLAERLLFSPLDFLANTQIFKKEENPLSNKFSQITKIDIPELLLNLDSDLGTTCKSIANTYELIPSSVISYSKDEKFSISCNFVARFNRMNGRAWVGTYNYQPSDLYDLNDEDYNSQVLAGLKTCYSNLNDIFKDHISGKLGTLEEKRFKKGKASLKMELYVDQYPKKFIAQTGNLVQLFDNREVKLIE